MSEQKDKSLSSFKTPFTERYLRFEISKEQIEAVINIIREKIKLLENKSPKNTLDQSIIDACIEDIFFLGKLQELNSVVVEGRKKVNIFFDNAVRELIGLIEDVLRDHDLSRENRREILENFSKIKERLLNDYMGHFTGQRFVEEMSRQYSERLQIYKHSHFMTIMTRQVYNKIKSCEGAINKDEKKIKSIGTLFFDLDGLKMLNDMSLGGYRAGDRALWVMARALSDEKLSNWAEENKIKLIPIHRSGDEFLMGVVAEDNVDLAIQQKEFSGVDGEKIVNISFLKYIGDYVKKKVQSFGQKGETGNNSQKQSIQDIPKNQVKPPKSMKDIIDFSDPKQQKIFAEIKKIMPKQEREVFDSDFIYQLSCSYGYVTLEDAIKINIQDKLDFEEEEVGYIMYKLAKRGLSEGASDKMKIDKKYSRSERKKSLDPKERLLEILYRTGREQRDWHIDKEDFIEIARVLFEFRDEVLKLRDELKNNKIKLIRERRARRSAEIRDGEMLKIQAVREAERNKEIASLRSELAEMREKLSTLESGQ